MKKILIQLWKQCNNKCSFCFQNKQFSDVNKENNIERVIQLLSEAPVEEMETINLMGGELFDFKWNDELSAAMDNLFNIFRKLFSNNLRHIYLMTNFIYTNSQLDIVLNKLSDVKDRISFCTSWDYEGRFRSEQDKELFYNNIRKYKKLGYEIFCSITLTEAFMRAVVEDKCPELFYLNNLIDGNISFHTPHGELFSEDKFDIDNFYPSRELFFKFIDKMIMLDKLNIEKFLNPKYYPDIYFYLNNDNNYTIVYESTLSIGSYSNSNKKMIDDYNALKESFEL